MKMHCGDLKGELLLPVGLGDDEPSPKLGSLWMLGSRRRQKFEPMEMAGLKELAPVVVPKESEEQKSKGHAHEGDLLWQVQPPRSLSRAEVKEWES